MKQQERYSEANEEENRFTNSYFSPFPCQRHAKTWIEPATMDISGLEEEPSSFNADNGCVITEPVFLQ